MFHEKLMFLSLFIDYLYGDIHKLNVWYQTHVQSGGSAWVAVLECGAQKENSVWVAHTCDYCWCITLVVLFIYPL